MTRTRRPPARDQKPDDAVPAQLEASREIVGVPRTAVPHGKLGAGAKHALAQDKRVIFMRCTENQAESDFDGGLVLLQAVQGQPSDDLIDARVVMSFRHDEAMTAFPLLREDKQAMAYRVTIEPVSLDKLPPAPETPDSAAALLQRAAEAAAREGNTALAENITATRSKIVKQ